MKLCQDIEQCHVVGIKSQWASFSGLLRTSRFDDYAILPRKRHRLEMVRYSKNIFQKRIEVIREPLSMFL